MDHSGQCSIYKLVAEINRGENFGTLPSKEEKILFNAIWGKKIKKRRKLKNGKMRKRKEKNLS